MTEDSQLTIKEVATLMKCSPRKVRGMIKSGKLKAHKFGGAWRIKLSALPGEAVKVVKVDDAIEKAEREARLAQARADKAEAENKEGEAKQAMVLRGAGMTAEGLEEKIKSFGGDLLEIERLMDAVGGAKDRLKLDWGKEVVDRWNELAIFINQMLGKDTGENTSKGVE